MISVLSHICLAVEGETCTGGTASKTNEGDAEGANGIVGWPFERCKGHDK